MTPAILQPSRMHPSLRHFSRDSSDITTSDEELSSYRDQLNRERNARTLTVRRTRPSILSFLSRQPPRLPQRPPPFLEASFALAQFATKSGHLLAEWFGNVVAVAQQSPPLVGRLLNNAAVQEAFVGAVTDSPNEEFTIAALRYIAVLFPLFPDMHVPFVDLGLCLGLSEHLASESPPLLEAAIACVDCISEASAYARDSVLCFGVHEPLIDCARRCFSEGLTVAAAEALHKVFGNREVIDANSLSGCVGPMASLLTLPFPAAVCIALSCFVSMTNKMPSLVFTLYEMELFPVIVGMLTDDRLVAAALPLVGNIALCQSDHMDALIKCNLFDILKQLLQNEAYTADAFWVLSNLLESVPDRTLRFFDDGLIQWTVARAADATQEVQKESVFFLATVVVSREADDLGVFVSADALRLMVQILRCSVWLIILRCLNALAKLVRVIREHGASDEVMAVVHGAEMRDALLPLLELPHALIGEWAEGLLLQIEGRDDGFTQEFDGAY
jgi:hypothetical protein